MTNNSSLPQEPATTFPDWLLDREKDVIRWALELETVAPIDDPQDFGRHVHVVIWTVIRSLASAEKSCDYWTVRAELARRNQLDLVDPIYLHALSKDSVRPSTLGLRTAAEEIITAGRERRLRATLQRHASDPSIDLAQVLADIATLQRPAVGRKSLFRTAKELSEAAERVEWAIPGFVALGAITELIGKAKLSGKTTLFAYWVACLLDGDLCFNAMAMTARVVWLTEQPIASFREVLRRAGLLDREDDLRILSYWDVKGMSWPAIAAMAGEEADRVGAKVIVVDTLPQFAGIKGDGENNSGDAIEALAPLQQLAHSGKAVVVSRHARKSGGEVGEDGRGSSAFTGGVDIVLSLKRPEGNHNHKPTARVLEGLSRFTETPERIVIEKRSVHGPDPEIDVWTEQFVVLGDVDAVAQDAARDALDRHLPTTSDLALPMTELEKVTGSTRATLTRAMKGMQGIQTVGKGGKKDPLRYFRPEKVCVQTSNPEGSNEQNRERLSA